jgi:hypothetical protein
MRPQFIVAYLFLGAVVISASGCAGLSAGQAWSENYALAPGVRANDPAIIDGNPQTIGQSQYVESSSETIRGLTAGSESVVLLPEPKPLHRITIHSDNLDAFDLWVADAQGRWKKIKEVKSNKEPIIDLKLRQAVHASGVKIRVRRTADDAELRRKNVRRQEGFVFYSGNTRALARIGEIELYGFALEGDKENPPSEEGKKETADDELDRLMNF